MSIEARAMLRVSAFW